VSAHLGMGARVDIPTVGGPGVDLCLDFNMSRPIVPAENLASN